MHNFFLSCDWGTSVFRLRLVDIQDHRVMEELVSNEGMAAVFNHWKEQSSQRNNSREEYSLKILQNHIDALGKKTTISLTGIPVLISGMASSSIGIRELPYASLPFSLDGSDARVEIIKPGADLLHEVMLISGISTKNDVMRGEETQMIGLAGLRADFDEEMVCIFPGTHSKHVKVRRGKLVDFKTYLTGELFDLMTHHSILKEAVAASGRPMEPEDKEAFGSGIIQSKESNVLNSLFSIRVNQLFKRFTKEQNFYYLSGLLIGAELKDLPENGVGCIQLCSGSNLYPLYALGLDKLNLSNKTALIAPELIDKSAVEGQIKIFHQHDER
jgi:2-dehydro-3-deoxygalactonokinase